MSDMGIFHQRLNVAEIGTFQQASHSDMIPK